MRFTEVCKETRREGRRAQRARGAIGDMGDPNVIDLGRDKQFKGGGRSAGQKLVDQPESAAEPTRVTRVASDWTCLQLYLNLERETRLELATPTLARSCSTN